MLSYRSDIKLDKEGRINLPRLKSIIESSPSDSPIRRQTSLMNIQRQKKNLQLMKQMVPLEESSESDGQIVLRKISTPAKPETKPEISVLTLNKNKKQRIHKRFTKQTFIGQQAIQKYYHRYKHMQKYKQKQGFMKENNVITQIVQLLDGHGFAPRKLDLIKLKGSHAILDLKKLGIGQGKMGNVVAEVFGLLGNFQFVDLSYNRIDRAMAQDLVSELGKVKIINLSHNRIGKPACDRLSQLLLSPKTQIQQLYLQENNLMDNAGVTLLKGISSYNYLRVLDISKNFMSTRFAQQFKQYLLKDKQLQELYLGWNQIGDKSAKNIFQAIAEHTELKVFDYSWNVVGVFSVSALEKVFRENQSLIHVDISFCDIDKKNSGLLSKALQSNHTIYGLHYQGNSGYINNKGYLTLTQKQHKQYPLPIIKGVIRKITSIHPNQIHNQYKSICFMDVCWICDCWQEMYFQVKNQDAEVKECFLHLGSQGWTAVKMETGEGCFQLFRMLEIGDFQFFFTYSKGPGQKTHFISPNYSFTINSANPLSFTIGNIPITADMPTLNTLSLTYSQDCVDQNYFPNIHCIPRSQEVLVKYSQSKQVNFKQYKKMLIKKRKRILRQERIDGKFRVLDQDGADGFLKDMENRDDEKDFLLKCLQFDIANSKIAKLIKKPEDLTKFKNMMLSYYKDFKDGYYYLAKFNPALNGLYSVSEILFQQFLQQQKYITKRVTLPKIMLKMYACLNIAEQEPEEKKSQTDIGQPTKNQKKGAAENRLLCRPQFLEFLIRLALQKWCIVPPKQKKSKQTDEKQQKPENDDQQQPKKQKIVLPLPLLEGLQRTIRTMTKYSSPLRASIWRKQRYLTIDIYTVLKGYESFINDVYTKYSESKKKLEKPKKLKGLLTLDEFKNMLIDADIKRTKEAAKDCEIPFLEAKRLEIQDGIVQFGLTFMEFCQCLARYSEILWYPPVSFQKHQLWECQAIYRYVPLFIRLQSLIIRLYRSLLEFQNRRMSKMCQQGLFAQQCEILVQKLKKMPLPTTTTDLSTKINNLEKEEEQISLRQLIQGLKIRHGERIVEREEEIQEEVEIQV